MINSDKVPETVSSGATDTAAVNSGEPPRPPKSGLTAADAMFLVFLLLTILLVALVGRTAYLEAVKTEVSKVNGETWVKWLSKNSAQRFESGFEPKACAGGPLPPKSEMASIKKGTEVKAGNNASATEASSAGNTDLEKTASDAKRTWGKCIAAFKAIKDPVVERVNPFSSNPVTFVAKCDPSNQSLAGSIVLEKLTPPPLGSASPPTASALLESDEIASKLQLRITICDKGAYPIRIAETEF